jgi:hypothetical protein
VGREASDWYRAALVEALRPLGDAEARFQVAYRHPSRADIAGACDQLMKAALQAESWYAEHPCPNADVNFHLKGQVQACRRIERAITSWSWRAQDQEFMSRIDFQISDLQHKLLWHRDAIAAWAEAD